MVVVTRKAWLKFNGGLISRNADARTDVRAYTYGLDECINVLPLVSGGFTRRGGFKKAAKLASDYSSSTPILKAIPFAFKSDPLTGVATGYWNVYVIAIVWNYTTSKANVLIYEPDGTAHASSPLLVDTDGNDLSFTQASIPKIRYDQKGDILDLVDSTHPPYQIKRTGTAGSYTFSITVAPINDNPFTTLEQIKYKYVNTSLWVNNRGNDYHPLNASDVSQLFDGTYPIYGEGIHNEFATNELFVSWGHYGNHGLLKPDWWSNVQNSAWKLEGSFLTPSTGKYQFAVNSVYASDVFVDTQAADSKVASFYGNHLSSDIGNSEFSGDANQEQGSKSLNTGLHNMIVRQYEPNDTVYGTTVAWRKESSATDVDGINRDADGSGSNHAELTLVSRGWHGRSIYEIEVEMLSTTTFRWRKRRWAATLDAQNNWTGSRVVTWTEESTNIWYGTAFEGGGAVADYGEPGAVYFNEVLGTKVTNKVDLNTANEWWWDTVNTRIYVYSTIDPDTLPQNSTSAVVIEVDYEFESSGSTWTLSLDTNKALVTTGTYIYVGNPSYHTTPGTKTWYSVQTLATIKVADGSSATDKYFFTVGFERIPLSVFESRESGQTVNKFPYVVKYASGRKLYGGTDYFPFRIWGSHSALYDEFNPGANDDEGIETDAVGTQLDKIQWIENIKKIIVGTESSIFLFPTKNDNFTPANSQGDSVIELGSAFIQPAKAEKQIFFAGSSGADIYEFSVNEFGEFGFNHLTALVEGLFSSDNIKEIIFTQGTLFSYSREKMQILWVLTNAGKLHSFSFDRSQEFSAWGSHQVGCETEETAKIYSICRLPFTGGHRLYAFINRDNLGLTLEYIDPDAFVDYQDSVSATGASLVIAGQEYFRVLGSDIASLANGDPVAAFAIGSDSRIYPLTLESSAFVTASDQFPVSSPYTVGFPGATDGQSWADQATTVYFGLYYPAYVTTLPPEFEIAGGTTQGMNREWSDLMLRLRNTLGRLTISRTSNASREIAFERGQIRYTHYQGSDEGNPKDFDIVILGGGEREQLKILQTSPTPLKVLMLNGKVTYAN